MSLGLFTYEGIFEAQTPAIDIDGNANPPLNHAGLAGLTLDDHTQYALVTGRNTTESTAHISNTSNPHSVTLNQITPTTATGDIIYANAPTTTTRLAIGASDDQALVVASGNPSWGPVLVSNTYNPTWTTVSGLSTAGGNVNAIYLRIGDMVIVHIEGSITFSAGAAPKSGVWSSTLPVVPSTNSFNVKVTGTMRDSGLTVSEAVTEGAGVANTEVKCRVIDQSGGTTTYSGSIVVIYDSST